MYTVVNALSIQTPACLYSDVRNSALSDFAAIARILFLVYVWQFSFVFNFFVSQAPLCIDLPSSGAFVVHLNMKSEWNEFVLEVAVSVSLNWVLLLEVHLICSDISISSCCLGLVSACTSKPVFTPRLDQSIVHSLLLTP